MNNNSPKTVPSPWSPVRMTRSGNHIEIDIWGRTYIWDNSLLPTAIKTADREILAAPMSLHAKFNGREEPFTMTSVTPISSDDEKVVFIIGQTAGNIIVNARFTVEFDGFTEMSLSVIPFWSCSPNNGKLASLDGLYIDIPLTKESSELFHFWPNGESGLIPDSMIMSSGAVPDEGITTPFKPYFWAGWEFGGLGIATESDENIHLKEGTPVFSLKNDGDHRLLRYNLMNKTPRSWEGRFDRWTDALEPIDFVICFQATPVKEQSKDRHNVRFLHDGYGVNNDLTAVDENGENVFDRYKRSGVNWIIFHEHWSAIQNYGQAADEEYFLRCVEECHKRGIKVMAYFGYEYATNAPGWHENRNDYLIKTPSGHIVGGWQRFNPCQRDYMVCYASGYATEMQERIKYAMDHYHLDGIYADSTYVPWECANPAHGCGYTDPDGVRHTTFPIRAVRSHVKEMYKIVHGMGGLIDTHQSSCLIAPTLAFADSFFNGESIQGMLKKDFLGFLNLPAFRCEFMGKNLGLSSNLLANIDESFSLEKAASLSIIHDVLPRPYDEESAKTLAPIWSEFEAFGAGDAAWHPYWDNDIIKIETENVYCSVYEKNGEYLTVFSSFNENTDSVSFTVNGERKTVKIDPFVPMLMRFPIK